MIPRFRGWYGNAPIRYKLLVAYSLAFALLFAAGWLVTYALVRKAVERSIESELTNSTASILNLVRTSAATSVRNYLHAVADGNSDIARQYWARHRRGELSEDEAKREAAKVMLSQTIGKTGYVCCLDSRGVMLIHPKRELLDRDLSEFAFVRELSTRKRGYLEYDWRNPGEAAARPKAMSMRYFEPWDWIIVASAYRDEFRQLVNVEDFREGVLSLKFGKTGYPYILDNDGNVILHPKVPSGNVPLDPGLWGGAFAEMQQKKTGKLVYFWKNPGETAPRKKLVIYNQIPEYGWIVASSSYLDEVYAPLRGLRTVFVLAGMGSLLLVLPLSLRIGSSITGPLQGLTEKLARSATEDLSLSMGRLSGDEVGRLAGYFNRFMESLEASRASLDAEIAEKQQAMKALRLSEELFSKAFRLSPHGIAVLALRDLRYLDANETFLGLTGYAKEDLIGRTGEDVPLLEGPAWADLASGVEQGRQVRGREVAFRTRSGDRRLGRLSAEGVEIWDEPCMLATIEDVTESRRLEREVIETGDRERTSIGHELHDDLGPHLIGIDALGMVLQRKLAGSAEGVKYAGEIRELIGEAIQKTRALARGLCPVHLVDNGLAVALGELAANTSALHGIPCEFRSRGEMPPLDASTATQLYYVAREAVHNAVKHSGASRITVELAGQGGELRLRVADDGRGIDRGAEGHGMGCRIMEYRARTIGAALELRSRPGQGTSVTVTLPGRTAGEEVG